MCARGKSYTRKKNFWCLYHQTRDFFSNIRMMFIQKRLPDLPLAPITLNMSVIAKPPARSGQLFSTCLTKKKRFWTTWLLVAISTQRMADFEESITFLYRVWQLAANCNAIDASINNLEVATTISLRLPQITEQLVVAIDAKTGGKSLSPDFVQSCLLLEKQRILNCYGLTQTADAVLLNDRQDWKLHRDHRHVPVSWLCRKIGHEQEHFRKTIRV